MDIYRISVLLLLSVQSVVAEWRVSVELVNYTAPVRNVGNHTCDRHTSQQHAECDPIFHLCQGSGDLTCSNSRPYNDTNSVVFGQEGTALFAPHVLASMPGHYNLDMRVYDNDPGTHNPASVHFARQSIPRAQMVPGAVIPMVLHNHQYRLVLNLVVQCNPPSVGPHCNCTPSYHTLCNATTGQHYCAPGYTSHGCRQTNTSCHVSTCSNGGTCEEKAHGFQCHCAPGFSGSHCQINVDDCAGVTCRNGGTCLDDVSGYVCECARGFLGPHCETALNASAGEMACQNGGSKSAGSSTCHCPAGYTGTTCETKLSGCLLNLCKNGGRCQPLSDSTYTCFCSFGFSGSRCEVDETDPCATLQCRHGGTCHALLGTPYCHCSPGYKGERCEVRADECHSSPCLHGGTCHDGVNSYTCTCRPGYMGHRCETEINQAPID